MAINCTVTSNGTISITDNQTGSVAQTIPALTAFVGSVAEYYPSLTVGTGTTTPALPVNQVQFIYIKNMSATATLTVTWTPASGISATILTLQPGSFISFCENNTSGGITALSMTASAGSTPVQLVLAG